MKLLLPTLLLALTAAASPQTTTTPVAPVASAFPAPTPPRTPLQAPLTIQNNHFLLNGKPFQILSGELEYTRIPRADWRDRLRKVRALGLNTVTVYVFWNVHEPTPGNYIFTGQYDVAEFLREAQQEGLYVILRPGPYACAEWDLGGYPAWLLKNPNMLLRSTQPAFLAAARKWMLRLGQELAPLQASRGGPILAVQVENEYGSFNVPDHSSTYLQAIHQIILDAGFTSSLLYTADGADVLAQGSLPNLLAAVDYGTGDAARSLALLHQFRPNAPVLVAEYWDGWFDHWGEPHQTTDAATQLREIRAVLAAGHSLSLYMVHGGTTFGWFNGANAGAQGYQPDVSSYDYDAPLDESGRPRPKYFALRNLITELTHTQPPPVPDSPPLLAAPPLTLTQTTSLWSTLPTPIQATHPLTMEALNQNFGYILYRTQIPEVHGPQTLTLDALHSYARLYLDGQLAGTLDRRLAQTSLTLTVHPHQQLDILVENTGRINFSPALRGERAGILGQVHLGTQTLTNWQIYPLPLDTPPTPTNAAQTPRPQRTPRLQSSPPTPTCPCFHTGTLTLTTPADTYLNTSQLGKGVLWVNGHLLGRFWNIGPTATLFLPGAWLHPGPNTLTVFDLDPQPTATLTPQTTPLYITPKPEQAH